MVSHFGASVIVLGMRGKVKTLTRLAIVATVTAGALLGGGSSAQADPPPGWEPGEYGLEADFADIGWTHRAWYDGVPGNVHTGYVNVEEDDDVLTVELNNWFCPSGVTPPGPYDDRNVATNCKWRSGKFVNYFQWWDVADFNQALDKLTVQGEFTDGFGTDTVSLDLVFKASGEPDVTIDESGPILDYSEYFHNVQVIGKVDGHKVSPATNLTQTGGRIGFYLDGWVRTP
jgi:hypothetical protein